MKTWVIWWLTGGPHGGVHETDVTNASRTMLMDLSTLAWDDGILDIMDIPRQMLPAIVPSSNGNFSGTTSADGPLGARVPVCGALGDQQAALVGQACFEKGEAYAAGLAVGFWSGLDELKRQWAEEKRWLPLTEHAYREGQYRGWQKALERTLGWVD
jgi:glycerol kinase